MKKKLVGIVIFLLVMGTIATLARRLHMRIIITVLANETTSQEDGVRM